MMIVQVKGMVDLEVQENNKIENERILKVSDIQKHLGISKTRAYNLMKVKSFPKIQIGHRYYIPESAYIQWIKDYTRRKIIM